MESGSPPHGDTSDIPSRQTEKEMVKRGACVMKQIVRNRALGKKFSVDWNAKGQPIGQNASPFISYIGVLVRMTVPITINNWRHVDKAVKDLIWDDIAVT